MCLYCNKLLIQLRFKLFAIAGLSILPPFEQSKNRLLNSDSFIRPEVLVSHAGDYAMKYFLTMSETTEFKPVKVRENQIDNIFQDITSAESRSHGP